jgi:hypothetical protein
MDSVAWSGVPKILKSHASELPINNTVKLTDDLRARVAKAMEAGGFTVWSEFCRVALTEKCQTVERDTRDRDPVEFARVYGRDGRDGKPVRDGKFVIDGK